MEYKLNCFDKQITVNSKNNVKLVCVTEELHNILYNMFQEIPYEEEYQDANVANGLSKDDFRKYCAILEMANKDILISYMIPRVTWFILFDNDKPIGWFTLKGEKLPKYAIHAGHIGYTIRPTERRKGYATKGLQQIIDIAKQLEYNEVRITTDDNNLPSIKLLNKCGFKKYPLDNEVQQITKSVYSGMSQYYKKLSTNNID